MYLSPLKTVRLRELSWLPQLAKAGSIKEDMPSYGWEGSTFTSLHLAPECRVHAWLDSDPQWMYNAHIVDA